MKHEYLQPLQKRSKIDRIKRRPLQGVSHLAKQHLITTASISSTTPSDHLRNPHHIPPDLITAAQQKGFQSCIQQHKLSWIAPIKINDSIPLHSFRSIPALAATTAFALPVVINHATARTSYPNFPSNQHASSQFRHLVPFEKSPTPVAPHLQRISSTLPPQQIDLPLLSSDKGKGLWMDFFVGLVLYCIPITISLPTYFPHLSPASLFEAVMRVCVCACAYRHEDWDVPIPSIPLQHSSSPPTHVDRLLCLFLFRGWI